MSGIMLAETGNTDKDTVGKIFLNIGATQQTQAIYEVGCCSISPKIDPVVNSPTVSSLLLPPTINN
jgi:hypothetical protein